MHLHHASDGLVVGKLSYPALSTSSGTDDSNSLLGVLSKLESAIRLTYKYFVCYLLCKSRTVTPFLLTKAHYPSDAPLFSPASSGPHLLYEEHGPADHQLCNVISTWQCVTHTFTLTATQTRHPHQPFRFTTAKHL